MSKNDASQLIDKNQLEYKFIRADGPGGQNVNKVATAVQLRYDMLGSSSLPEDVKKRLIKIAGKRMTREGLLVIEAKRYRTQEANRADALTRLYALLQKALEIPKTRRKTIPTVVAKKKRFEAKRQRGQLKQQRRKKFIIE